MQEELISVLKMKHVSNIVISLALSIIVSVLSAGVSFVRSCHNGSTQMVQIAGIVAADDEADECCGSGCNGKEECCDQPSMECGDVTLVKLAPYNIAQDASPCFSVYPIALLFAECTTEVASLEVADVPALQSSGGGNHSSPRSYLRLLDILLI